MEEGEFRVDKSQQGAHRGVSQELQRVQAVGGAVELGCFFFYFSSSHLALNQRLYLMGSKPRWLQDQADLSMQLPCQCPQVWEEATGPLRSQERLPDPVDS